MVLASLPSNNALNQKAETLLQIWIKQNKLLSASRQDKWVLDVWYALLFSFYKVWIQTEQEELHVEMIPTATTVHWGSWFQAIAQATIWDRSAFGSDFSIVQLGVDPLGSWKLRWWLMICKTNMVKFHRHVKLPEAIHDVMINHKLGMVCYCRHQMVLKTNNGVPPANTAMQICRTLWGIMYEKHQGSRSLLACCLWKCLET